MDTGPFQGFVEAALEISEEELRITTVQIYADDGEQKLKNATPQITNVVKTTNPVGSMNGTTSNQIEGN